MTHRPKTTCFRPSFPRRRLNGLAWWTALALILLSLGAAAVGGAALMAASRVESKVLPEVRILVGQSAPRQKSPHLARNEPERGCYLGAFIEFDPRLKQTYRDQNGSVRKIPSEFEALVGKPHAMYFFYLGYGMPLPMDWMRRLADAGKMVHVALEPNGGLDQVRDDAYLHNLADDLRAAEAKVFVRFASEMNGPWTNYDGDPRLYREKFRLVSKVLRQRAPNVAMVWCPYFQPVRPIDSYYPGDAWVDWVGVNMYNVTYFNQDPKMPARHIRPSSMLDAIYSRYAARKPIMIGEYATTRYSALENRPVTEYAVRNIQELYRDLRTRYPRVKAINYFNSNNLLVPHRKNNDYSVTGDPKVLDAYRAAIASNHFLAKDDGARPVPVGEAALAQDGMAVRGKVVVSAWAQAPTVARTVVFDLDGKALHRGVGSDEWCFELDPERVGRGAKRLTARAYDRTGTLVASRSIAIDIE